MLHQLLAIKRPLIVLDTETTGLDPKDARIIEIGFQVWIADGLQKEWRSLVNPGVPIPPESVKVHHIDPTIMDKCAKCYGEKSSHDERSPSVCDAWRPIPTFAQLAPNLAKGLTDVDFAGKHVRFDLRTLAAEMERARVAWSYLGARIVDADRLEQLGEPRSLSHLYKKHVGRDPEDAHQALADVRMTTEVIEAQLRKYDTLPRDLDQLHELQWPGYLCDGGQFKMINGIATCCFGKKWNGRPMKDVDRGYYEWIMREDFPADVKKLAMDALMGVFPEVK